MKDTVDIPAPRTRRFLPEKLEVEGWEDIEPYYQQLLTAEPDSVESLEKWMRNMSELIMAIYEEKAWRFIRMTRDTSDQKVSEEYQQFVKEIMPKLERSNHALLQKLYDSPFYPHLDSDKYRTLIRSVSNRIDLFREESIPVKTQIQSRSREFDQIAGGIHIEVNGEKITLQKAVALLESQDRNSREDVWRRVSSARLAHKDKLDELLSDLIGLRTQVAQHAGYQSFADYKFKALERFDYTREDCYQFHASIASEVTPIFEQQAKKRQEKLGLDKLRPWDLTVDLYSQNPLRPFKNSGVLVDGTVEILNRLSPQLGDQIRTMQAMGHLDLESRLGKAPGGYNYPLPETGVPFVFMNAVGTQEDLTTMLHESGHAIHSFAIRDYELAEFKFLPSEVAELASMSMELITMDYWDVFYKDPEELIRAKRGQIMRLFSLLPWIAAIDAFQHWIYDNPGHTASERANKWVEIYLTYHGDTISWDGLEEDLCKLWQKQGHIFDVPFYYIEYGIAQLGALAVWRNFKQNPEAGLDNYLKALALGYSRTIPEIYGRAGIRFDFSASYIRELCDFVQAELDAIEQ